MSTGTCRSCGEELKGPYCHHCGQKKISNEDKAVKHVFAEVINSLLFVENKIYKSLKLLLIKPAEMPAAYISGATNKYLKPVQFFLIANLVYFIFPVFATFNTSFNTQMNGLPYSSIAKDQISRYLDRNNLDYDEYEKIFNRSSKQISKTIVIAIVPLFGLVFQLLNIRQKQLYFADYLTMAFYFSAFLLLFMIQLFPALIVVVYKGMLGFEFGHFEVEVIYSAIITISIVFYSYVIFNKLTAGKKIYNLAKALIVGACLFPILHFYRLILLLTTLGWLKLFQL